MSKRFTFAVLVLLVVVGAALSTSPVSAGGGKSPDGQVLVVTANLKEAYPDGNDLQRTGDMRVFVTRLLDQTPFAPDVLHLQEVRRQSAVFVARVLSNRTGRSYIVAVKPPRDIITEEGGQSVHTDTAIILNRATMVARSKPGYIRTTYDRSESAPGKKVIVRRQAHIAAEERATGTTIASMSLRFAHISDLRSRDVSFRLRYQWSNQMAGFIDRRYPATAQTMRVIAGDFNAVRCMNGDPRNCREAGFWKLMTGDRYNYKEALFRSGLATGVDYIFIRDDVADAGFDRNYDADRAERGLEPYYSDHRFRWAVVTPP